MTQLPETEKKKPKGLGRGLAALLDDDAPQNDDPQFVPLARIINNPDQPRRHFEDIEQLAQSIKSQGMLQPILVHPADANNIHKLIAGERRWRAAQIAKLDLIPIRILKVSQRDAMIIALVENIQRNDLNPIEAAKGIARLCHFHQITHQEVSIMLGQSRSHTTNLLRLLALPQIVQQMVIDGKITMGHARLLVGRSDAPAIAQQIADEGLSVRESEALVTATQPSGVSATAQGTKSAPQSRKEKSADVLATEQALRETLGMEVTIQPKGDNSEKGKLTIHYQNLNEFDRVLHLLGKYL